MSRHQPGLPPLVEGSGSLDDAIDWIRHADRVLIGAGAGLSASAGFDYGDRERFRDCSRPCTRRASGRAMN